MKKLGFRKVMKILFLFIFSPKNFIKLEEEDNKNQESSNSDKNELRVYILRRAHFYSFIVIVISGILGFTLGKLLSIICPNPGSVCITLLQIFSVLTFLWATLALGGWSIQSWGGVTYTEKVNNWIFRLFYFLGTLIFIISLTWQ